MGETSIDGRLDEVLRTLAERVRRLRRDRDLTVVGLSFEAGLSESRVRAIEAGRTTASLATLVALAETFEVDLADLFGGPAREPVEDAPPAVDDVPGWGGELPPAPWAAASPAPPVSPYVVPSEVVWGGELPPAPWIAASPAPPVSPYVVPSEVVWGGELPSAPWTSATAAPTMPEPVAGSVRSDAVAATYAPTEATWGGALPPAPWAVPSAAPAPRDGHSVPSPSSSQYTDALVPHAAPPTLAPHDAAASSAVPAHAVAQIRHAPTMESPYVLVASGPTATRQPRTFSELREGALAGREFATLREFAVAAVVDGGFSAVAVARVFRLPAWRLEQWVSEAGYVSR